MNIEELLPIGSIVRLNEGIKKLMIFGVKQTNPSDGKDYDYIGVLYPEGNMGVELQLMFNHDLIEEVVHRGYEDEERPAFLEKLKKALQ